MVKCALVMPIFIMLLLCAGVRTAWAYGDVSRAFSASNSASLVAGDLASTAGDGSEVAAANMQNGNRLVGVVVDSSQTSLALESSAPESVVQVVLSGNAEAYVTTLGGDIHAGDAISVSPVSGFGMRAGQGLRIVGIAQADVTSTTPGVHALYIKDARGISRTVYMGAVPIVVGVGSGAVAASAGLSSSLQSLATVVAGHQVSTLQATLSFIIVVISVGALMALIYGAIHAGIVAIGRNPLALWSILRSVLQILGMGLLIAAVAAVALYFTLRP